MRSGKIIADDFMDKIFDSLAEDASEPLTDQDIGSDEDYANLETEKLWRKELSDSGRLAELNKLDKECKTVRYEVLFREGFHEGRACAVEDYVAGDLTTDKFEEFLKSRNTSDGYSMGFELGYFRKLAEILVA